VFPSVDLERELLAGIDAELVVSDGTAEGLVALGAVADGILNTYLPIGADLIARLPRCRIIARYGIGVDNIDVAAANRAGITVTNVPDYSVEEVAVHTLALILAMIRRLAAADRKVRDGGWGLDGLRPIPRLSTLRFGLVGYGRIGQRVARALGALEGRVTVHDPYLVARPDLPPLVALDELVASSDVISIHAPLTPQTRGLFDARLIGAMPRGSLLVNTSRGGLVVVDAVFEALRTGQLAGAALDVFEQEPVDAARLESVPNLLVTPHMAYYSEQSLAESQRKAATQVAKVLSGEQPDYPITP
jgi:D-3-phosphoglycerate dehydrogenase